MNNWQSMHNSPQEEMAYWRTVRQYGMFVVALLLVFIFSLVGFVPGVVAATALSVVPGVATFRRLIGGNAVLRNFARLGEMRRRFLILLVLVFLVVILVQAFLAVEVGAWLAGVVSPIALVVEWLIARELSGTRSSRAAGRTGLS